MAGGATKRIEEIRPGDIVLAVSESHPEGSAESREVVDVYHNKPARLLNLHIGEEVIRATHNHPFYVRAKGWTPADHLKIGDQFRTHQGEWIELIDRFENGDIESVFNLRVADDHTYFVTAGEGTAVLVHNEIPEKAVTIQSITSNVNLRRIWEKLSEKYDDPKEFIEAYGKFLKGLGKGILEGIVGYWDLATGTLDFVMETAKENPTGFLMSPVATMVGRLARMLSVKLSKIEKDDVTKAQKMLGFFYYGGKQLLPGLPGLWGAGLKVIAIKTSDEDLQKFLKAV